MKDTTIFTCVVCGARLPHMTRQELRDAGCSTLQADGSEVHHCPAPVHTVNEIQKMICANPHFVRASEYRKYASDTE